MLLRTLVLLLFGVSCFAARADDGYRLWLRYEPITEEAPLAAYRAGLGRIVLLTPSGNETPSIDAARRELAEGIRGLLGHDIPIKVQANHGVSRLNDGYFVFVGREPGFQLPGLVSDDSVNTITISASRDIGVLYGAFALLRHLQLRQPIEHLKLTSEPKIERRILNHWDNLNRFVERGYAGFSLWEWYHLPDVRSARYRDYARACASIGLNGAVLTNVNANALVLTPEYLAKAAALADEFRPYGIRVYLTARFSAPIEIGKLTTADPLDPEVIAWWNAKVAEIYRFIPDFGGFVVKANSEGQPGPNEYGRNHAEGANLFANALAPHGGIVMWRAFVYAADNREDRVKQAYNQFAALDGRFRDNVVLQIKNGPLDFMPREPFHPLFGAMPRTHLAAELQITQEYLGGATHLAYLAPMWKEVLDADTFARGPGSTVARVIDGTLREAKLSVIAGVANTGTDRNWTGHPLSQANWYAFGRLAWDHSLTSEQIADEWTRLTFGSSPKTAGTISKILLGSRETVVNYSMPLGLHHIMAEGHHFGPGPWVTHTRADWSSIYYHQADENGLGAARSAGGSDAVAQYAPELAKRWGDPATCPENLLLWFHHLPWEHKMKSGRPLWDELALRYQQGVDEMRALQREWDSLRGEIDAERFTHVQALLRRQEADARDWRDACLLYFQTFSKRPLPAGVEPPPHDLDYYKAIKLRYAPGHPGDY
ncbi:MAG TPA: alpha-glucuronidase family glycosyl hydrolase [Opitutaceae bacterium]|nr:alpha-glucuronidase family glycosyl hydrolase [Opitutaceae bacterium]